MKILSEVLKLSTGYLEERQIARARRSAEELIAHALQCKRLELYMAFERPMEEKELAILRQLLKRKGAGEPLEYITGHVDFYGCRLNVNPDVLIPRPETEILLDMVCKEWGDLDKSGKVAWDICCGSGCLGIGFKKKFPEFQVALADLSVQALEVCRSNARLNEVDVEFVQGDFLAPLQRRKADLVLCNPPYISESDYAALDPSVREFEPKGALVGGKTGLEFYRRLAHELPPLLNPGARVYLEIGHDQGESVKEIFELARFRKVLLKKDWAGKDRFFFLEIE